MMMMTMTRRSSLTYVIGHTHTRCSHLMASERCNANFAFNCIFRLYWHRLPHIYYVWNKYIHTYILVNNINIQTLSLPGERLAEAYSYFSEIECKNINTHIWLALRQAPPHYIVAICAKARRGIASREYLLCVSTANYFKRTTTIRNRIRIERPKKQRAYMWVFFFAKNDSATRRPLIYLMFIVLCGFVRWMRAIFVNFVGWYHLTKKT